MDYDGVNVASATFGPHIHGIIMREPDGSDLIILNNRFRDSWKEDLEHEMEHHMNGDLDNRGDISTIEGL